MRRIADGSRSSRQELDEIRAGAEERGFQLVDRELWADQLRLIEAFQRTSAQLYEAMVTIRNLGPDRPVAEAIRLATEAIHAADEDAPSFQA